MAPHESKTNKRPRLLDTMSRQVGWNRPTLIEKLDPYNYSISCGVFY